MIKTSKQKAFQTPLDCSALSREQFDAEIEKGIASLEAGKTKSAKQVRENMKKYELGG